MTPFDAGVESGIEKTAKVGWQDVAMGVAGIGTGALAIYDFMKSRGFDKDSKLVMKALKSGKRVNSKDFVKKVDPKIQVVTTASEVRRVFKDEFKFFEPMSRWVAPMTVASAIESKTNAFAMRGRRGDYVFVSPQSNAQVLAHEIGHILDFRKKGVNVDNNGPYNRTIMAMFWKPSYERSTMAAERAAWEKAPGRKGPTPLETGALGTYDKGFHLTRGVMAGYGAAAIGASMIGKLAAGVASPIGGTGENPTTGGELEPRADDIRHTRHPTRAERRLVRPRKKMTKASSIINANTMLYGSKKNPGKGNRARELLRHTVAMHGSPSASGRAIMKKNAENVSQTVSSGNQSQTPGEAEAASSASGHGSTSHSAVQTNGRVERGPGNQKSGVPIWIRFSKNLASKATRDGGDKVGPQRGDNQFNIPVKDSRPT